MDKFNNSNSSLALQKFYNQQNHDIRLLELQQRLKTEKIVCQIEMSKLINEEKVILEESNTVFEDTFNQQESLSGEPGPPTVFENTVSLEDICYRSNENFEIDKPGNT